MNDANLRKKVDYSGKEIFVGMDVHNKNWAITTYYEQMLLRTINQPPSIDGLANYLNRTYPGATYVCGYESGFCGFWIQRELVKKGIACKVIHAADIPQTGKGKVMKNDKRDSKRIGLSLATKSVESIYIPDIISESDRSLIRYRSKIIKDITRNKNRIKGILLEFGIKLPEKYVKNWSKNFLNWLRTLSEIEKSLKFTLLRMVDMIELHRGLLLKVNMEIRQLMKEIRFKEKAENLMSVPGVGPITAMTLITEIIDITRFKNFKQLNSFIGFCPMEYSSGDKEYKGKITVRRNRFLRNMLIEASWISIRHDPTLTLYYKNCITRMSGKRAIIKVARRLLSRIYRVLVTGDKYITGIEK